MEPVAAPASFPVDEASLRVEQERAEASASAHHSALLASARTLPHLEKRCDWIVRSGRGRRAKLAQLRNLADELALDIAPHAICQRGCSSCCHIAVVLTAEEAAFIGQDIGVPPQQPQHLIQAISGGFQQERSLHVDRWFGSACPFLSSGECGIYPWRPLACRLHFSLGASPVMCDPRVPSEHSRIPNIDLPPFWIAALVALGASGGYGDIREFFPDRLAASPAIALPG